MMIIHVLRKNKELTFHAYADSSVAGKIISDSEVIKKAKIKSNKYNRKQMIILWTLSGSSVN